MSTRFYYEWARRERRFVVWDRLHNKKLAFCPDRDVAEQICLMFYKESLKQI